MSHVFFRTIVLLDLKPALLADRPHGGLSPLAGERYEVLAAGRGDEAIDLFSAHGETIDLVLTDVIMPGWRAMCWWTGYAPSAEVVDGVTADRPYVLPFGGRASRALPR